MILIRVLHEFGLRKRNGRKMVRGYVDTDKIAFQHKFKLKQL
jgi:hypothetical protein